MRRLYKFLELLWFFIFIYLIILCGKGILKKEDKRYTTDSAIISAWFYECKNIVNIPLTKELTKQKKPLVDSVKSEYIKFIVNTKQIQNSPWIIDSINSIKVFVCSDSFCLINDEAIKGFFTNMDYISLQMRGDIPQNFVIIKQSEIDDGETLVHELSHYVDNLLGGGKNNSYWSNHIIKNYMDDYLLNYEFDEEYAYEKLIYIGVCPEYCNDYIEFYKNDADYYTDPTEFFARTMVMSKKYKLCPNNLLLDTLSYNINEEKDIVDLLFWSDLDKLGKLRDILNK
jgi:hypothetical protein